MRRLRVLVLLHPDLMPPDSLKGYSEKEIHVWKTEYDVITNLRAIGHDRVRDTLGGPRGPWEGVLDGPRP